jgi:hypothetical protein
MAADRLSKDEFYAKVGDLDEERLRKALWNVYWRGSAQVRERIEDQITPETTRPKPSDGPPAPERILRDVREFCALAYKGAFIGAPAKGMNPRRRSQWRHEFRRHYKAADEAMTAGSDAGAEAVEAIIALAVHCGTYDTFASREPLETAKFVVSDAVERLWRNTFKRHGFEAFAARSTGQLIAWEAEYGWTVSGYGPIAEQERRLAEVLGLLLPGIDQWQTYARHYLDALDQAPPVEPRILAASFDIGERDRSRRSEKLDVWHSMLLERLADGEDTGLRAVGPGPRRPERSPPSGLSLPERAAGKDRVQGVRDLHRRRDPRTGAARNGDAPRPRRPLKGTDPAPAAFASAR